MAEDQGHQVLFLPVHHPELNPIELVWATVKHYCGTIFSNSTSFKEQRQHLEESFERDITPEYCTKLELFPNKGSGRLSSQKAMEGANQWGCKSEMIVR